VLSSKISPVGLFEIWVLYTSQIATGKWWVYQCFFWGMFRQTHMVTQNEYSRSLKLRGFGGVLLRGREYQLGLWDQLVPLIVDSLPFTSGLPMERDFCLRSHGCLRSYGGIPKSSMLVGFSLTIQLLGYPHLWKPPLGIDGSDLTPRPWTPPWVNWGGQYTRHIFYVTCMIRYARMCRHRHRCRHWYVDYFFDIDTG